MMFRYFRVVAALLLLCMGGMAFAQTPQASDGANLEAAVTAAQTELAAATARLTELEATYGDLPWTKDKTDEFVALGKNVDTLRAQIVALGTRLAGLNAANAAVAASVSISPVRASLNEYGGPPLPASVAEGAVLAFETMVRHAASDTPNIVNLSWRVLDSAGRSLPEYAKDEQVAEVGTSKPYRYRIRLTEMPNGVYRVAFTHTPVLDQTQATTVESGFTVSQAVRIARLVVSPDAAATRHAETLYVEQIPHLFAYFSAVDVPTVTVDFVVRSAKDGAEKYRQRTERTIKPDEAETRVGLRLDPGIVREGDDLVFAAALTGPDGATVSREIPFAVRGHTATITLASQLTSNEPASFRIEAPAYFAPPLRVDLQPSSATASLTGATNGTLVAVSDARGGNGSLRATVTDAQGRVARAMASFVIAPPQPVAPPPVVAAAPPPRPVSDDWVTALDSTAPPQAPPPPEPEEPAGPTIAEALATFQSQVAQIQANRQAVTEDSTQLQPQPQMRGLMDQNPGAFGPSTGGAATTLYWVLYVEDICGDRGCPTVSVTTGPQPPATGFSNPNSAAPGYFLRVTKAYGTLDGQEAQRVADGIRSRALSTSDYFPVTRRYGHGYESNGHLGPLVRYGAGVEARLR